MTKILFRYDIDHPLEKVAANFKINVEGFFSFLGKYKHDNYLPELRNK